MSATEEASHKLEAALDHLDRVVEAERARRGALQQALQAARTDNEQLRSLADEMSGRLDRAIARLQSILEE